MKVLKNSFLFFLILLFVVLNPISCSVNNKERDLSTPLSRLVGHWKTKYGVHLYFGEVYIDKGSLVQVMPDKGKWIKNLNERGKKITKEAQKEIENFAGKVINCEYKVISQEFEGLKLELEISYDINDAPEKPQKITYHINKDGMSMTWSTIVPFVGEHHDYTPIEYIDSKTSPEDKKIMEVKK